MLLHFRCRGSFFYKNAKKTFQIAFFYRNVCEKIAKEICFSNEEMGGNEEIV